MEVPVNATQLSALQGACLRPYKQHAHKLVHVVRTCLDEAQLSPEFLASLECTDTTGTDKVALSEPNSVQPPMTAACLKKGSESCHVPSTRCAASL